jgi:hypothetical protein
MRRELVISLNPFHAEDLRLIEALKNTTISNDMEITIRASLLLKHDWERAKEEAKPIWNRRIRPLHRVTFEEYMSNYKLFLSGNDDLFEKNMLRITEDEPWC